MARWATQVNAKAAIFSHENAAPLCRQSGLGFRRGRIAEVSRLSFSESANGYESLGVHFWLNATVREPKITFLLRKLTNLSGSTSQDLLDQALVFSIHGSPEVNCFESLRSVCF